MLMFITSAFTIILIINFLAFLFAFKWQTDKLTDITYSLSFIVAVLYSYVSSPDWSWVQMSIAVAIVLWAIRLGGYLFWRVHKVGKDDRFDEMRPIWYSYIKFWILQALSICVVVLPAVIALHKNSGGGDVLNVATIGGLILIVSGWFIEAIADYQKSAFKSKTKGQNVFMKSGLYSIVRFPNYLGEILFWIGIFILATPYLDSWEYVSIVSPIWIIVLLTRISGIPLLVQSHDIKYGSMSSYQEYKKSTAKLVPGVY